MDESTRPSHTHRQRRADTRRAAAVSLFLALASSEALASPSPHDILNPPATQSIANATTHEISIASVEAGQESIALAARLTTTSAFVARDVAWIVRNGSGEVLLDATANELQSPLPPGDYVIEAQYGAVSLRETVQLTEGKSVAVNFVLNAGGLRVLPEVKGLSSGDFESQVRVYALSGPQRGKLVALSDIPGEMLKLVAGTYRVESRFGKGNTVAVTDVRIRPGKMSAIELTHAAGIARLGFSGKANVLVHWTVRAADGSDVVTFEGGEERLALKPGDYVAEALVNGETRSATFTIVAGEERQILLGE
jgi:hypothetical protein